MLRKALVIISCFCMVGMTIVPASAIPCCCKKGVAKKAADSSVPPCCCRPQQDAKSCCGTQPTDISKRCPVCKCLEQLQIITLPNGSLYDDPGRGASAYIDESDSDDPDDIEIVQFHAASVPYLQAINLRTCTLRC
jgi:hypothetical protein